MAFKATAWEFSNETEKALIPPEPGLRNLLIDSANYDEENQQYFLSVTDLDNGAQFTLRYWLTTSDKDNNVVPNHNARRTLISLGVALAGKQIGIPAPCDITGAVVAADVSLKVSARPDGSVRNFPKVFTFSTAPADVIAAYSTIDQYAGEGETSPDSDSEAKE